MPEAAWITRAEMLTLTTKSSPYFGSVVAAPGLRCEWPCFLTEREALNFTARSGQLVCTQDGGEHDILGDAREFLTGRGIAHQGDRRGR